MLFLLAVAPVDVQRVDEESDGELGHLIRVESRSLHHPHEFGEIGGPS
jgi:hypothetical protein